MNRAARSIRSGSSLKRHLRRQRRTQRAGHQIGGAAERIDERRRRAVSSSAMALTVKSRRDRSASIVVGELDVRLARVVVVRLGAMGGDLVDPIAALGADRAEALALGPDRVGPTGEARLDLGRAGRRGGVEVEVVGVRRRGAGRARSHRRGTAGARRPRTVRSAGRARRGPAGTDPGSQPSPADCQMARHSIDVAHARARPTSARSTSRPRLDAAGHRRPAVA